LGLDNHIPFAGQDRMALMNGRKGCLMIRLFGKRTALIAGIVAFLAGCGSPPDEPGVLVDGERLAVVDVHLHTGDWEHTPPGFRDRLSERVPRGFKWTLAILTDKWLSGEHLLDQLDNAGVRAAGVFAVYSPHTTGIATNEFMSEVVATDPSRLFGFASIRVDQWNLDGPEQLAKFESDLVSLEHVIGVKLAHAHQQFRFDDERYWGIYEIAGRLDKPIYLHTATSPNPGTRIEPPYTDPHYLEKAIKEFPDTIFILGHTGWDSYRKKLTYVDACIDLAQRYDNVYMEPGALGAERAAEVLPDFLQRIKNGDVTHKLIYGSDGPQYPGYIASHLQAFVAGMNEAGYTADEMRLILADNFSHVFKLPKFEP
jgi:predicted TIM-barrel fold metal-dependent hydrolase